MVKGPVSQPDSRKAPATDEKIVNKKVKVSVTLKIRFRPCRERESC